MFTPRAVPETVACSRREQCPKRWQCRSTAGPLTCNSIIRNIASGAAIRSSHIERIIAIIPNRRLFQMEHLSASVCSASESARVGYNRVMSTTESDRWSARVSGNIRAEMARRRWTYDDLSANTDIPIYTIRRRMNDKTHSFTIDELQSISEAMGIPLLKLLWEQ